MPDPGPRPRIFAGMPQDVRSTFSASTGLGDELAAGDVCVLWLGDENAMREFEAGREMMPGTGGEEGHYGGIMGGDFSEVPFF